ncbi:hypothetical protein K491DRAFT_758392 [Lophiostoma macrostomum CBS 122681]|uniref:Cytochrome P450 n=1 Tax=Lophiostoma macrostomum CBS 122681 TaxID=1314788 RepID=A0A6A6T8D1_9PLEO|nr:hypothetical protein K491DRAFT_758392 [Lophiostoma macrostomum CBS 122681]
MKVKGDIRVLLNQVGAVERCLLILIHRVSLVPHSAMFEKNSSFTCFHKRVIRPSSYHKEVAKLHQKYGDFTLRKSAVAIIHGPGSECRKSTWYGQMENDPRKASMHTLRDHNMHRSRRRAWKACALSTYEPRIETKTDLLLKQLKNLADMSVDVTSWSMLFTFDVMGEVGFGEDFRNLATGVEHPAIGKLHTHMTMMGILGTVRPAAVRLSIRAPSRLELAYNKQPNRRHQIFTALE